MTTFKYIFTFSSKEVVSMYCFTSSSEEVVSMYYFTSSSKEVVSMYCLLLVLKKLYPEKWKRFGAANKIKVCIFESNQNKLFSLNGLGIFVKFL